MERYWLWTFLEAVAQSELAGTVVMSKFFGTGYIYTSSSKRNCKTSIRITIIAMIYYVAPFGIPLLQIDRNETMHMSHCCYFGMGCVVPPPLLDQQ